MRIIFYHSETCPKCKVLETKMKAKKIEYESVVDMDIMQAKGIKSIPCLEIDGVLYGFKTTPNDAVEWVNNYNG